MNIHIRCRPPCCPMSQISPYLVNCGLSRSLTPAEQACAGSPVAIGARRSVVRTVGRDSEIGVRHRYSQCVDGVRPAPSGPVSGLTSSANRRSCVTTLTAPLVSTAYS